ncbi:MAG: hypothetical protein FWE74_00060 [Oscillospiraceae bacterium]|nr:hypothetical protein [Oscillospiraceae bacterium]
MNGKKYLHGNNTRMKPDKSITPRFTNYVVNNYTTRDGTVYYHLPDDAEVAKKEVDDNKL